MCRRRSRWASRHWWIQSRPALRRLCGRRRPDAAVVIGGHAGTAKAGTGTAPPPNGAPPRSRRSCGSGRDRPWAGSSACGRRGRGNQHSWRSYAVGCWRAAVAHLPRLNTDNAVPELGNDLLPPLTPAGPIRPAVASDAGERRSEAGGGRWHDAAPRAAGTTPTTAADPTTESSSKKKKKHHFPF